MKKAILILVLLPSFLSLSAQSEDKKIVILYTNDMHSRLTGYGPESSYSPLTAGDDNTIGGFARIASIIKNEKKANTGTTLVLDAGDFLMGTLFQDLEPKRGLQLPLMKKMGYDVVCIGNHEFDFGPGKLAGIVSASVKTGDIPALLLGNAVFTSSDNRDDELENLFTSETINRKYTLTQDGFKTGFFSIMGQVADENAAFAPPVTFAKQIPFAKKMVKELEAEGCDLIICLSHSGVNSDKKGGWSGEDVKLAEKVKGIDVIISGHTHTLLKEPLLVNGIPIVQAGYNGQFVGKLTISLEKGKAKVLESSIIPVDDRISGDLVIHELIEGYKIIVDNEILKPLGMDYGMRVAEAGFLLECVEEGDVEGSNLGPFVADAIHTYVNKHSSEGTDVSMVAAGVIREKIMPGFQTAPDIFRIMSMGTGEDGIPGYPLARVYVTGKELKSILEILQVSQKSTPGNYCYYSGIRVVTDPEKGLLKKILRIEIADKDGTLERVDFSKKNRTLYSLTANSYMLQFIGIIKKMSFGLINVVPKNSAGIKIADIKNAIIDINSGREGIQEGKEWLALIEYLASMKDMNGNGIPEIDRKYEIPVRAIFPDDTK